ncbi:hypothetical protein [Streptomyces sp. TRM64462]|uniref:hypothetical protein n=1 Tax=Streptomyces sp. TRM64462 TaxID=2741726 RepID=UPI00158641F5|nr:hypothetical protein [Streptomyces sp. TRM64462]
MNLRMIGLGAVVAAATLIPLVATAGPAAGPLADPVAVLRGPGASTPTPTPTPTPASAQAPAPVASGAVRGSDPASAPASRSTGSGTGSGTTGSGTVGSVVPPLLAESDAPQPGPGAALIGGRAAQCGPSLVSPHGVEAQTCVLAEGEDVWARTYYRNTSGRELRAILSLMGPADRTVRTHCAVGAGDEPGACESPRERGRGDVEEYTAVAEFAADGDPDSPLLLRSGSNAPKPSAR